MNKIPFFSLTKQTTELKPQLDNVWNKIVNSSQFILGDEVKLFEESFANFIEVDYAVGVSTGLDALTLSLRVLGIGKGDEVIVPANTFIATALAVSQVGAKPVFIDVEPDNLLINLELVKKATTRRTKAIIPVHLFGQIVIMNDLLSFCERKNIKIVEDACQAHGASYNEKKCGSFGDLGAFSFYPSKNLGAFGDGGMVTTNNVKYYEKLIHLRNYGSTIKYHHLIKGYNNRLDNLQAAILNIKLGYLEFWNNNRRFLAGIYNEQLEGISQVTLLKYQNFCERVHHLYVIRVSEREKLKNYLAIEGIETAIHYPFPIHKQEAYFNENKKLKLPIAEKAAQEILSLPMYPEMSEGHVIEVCNSIKRFYQ